VILDAFRLDNRVALVTGAARGLGQALALGLAEAGADVALLDVLPLTETHERIEAVDRRCHPLDADLRGVSPATADAVVAQVVGALGRLDILVNNAGINRRAPAVDYPQADWEAVLDVNLAVPFYLSQAAARHFLGSGRGGKIVNMASMQSYQGGLSIAPYAAAKHGIAGLTRALSNEWARHGINVNAIAPGYMATEMTAPVRADPTRADSLFARIPAGRWGDPTDLQGAVVFLCSDAAAYVHGTILPVDGGWLAW